MLSSASSLQWDGLDVAVLGDLDRFADLLEVWSSLMSLLRFLVPVTDPLLDEVSLVYPDTELEQLIAWMAVGGGSAESLEGLRGDLRAFNGDAVRFSGAAIDGLVGGGGMERALGKGLKASRSLRTINTN